MNKPPGIRVGDRGMLNWKEIQRWGRLNDPLWQKIEEEACLRGLTETEHLQWLIAGLLQAKYELLGRIVQYEIVGVPLEQSAASETQSPAP